MSEPQFWICGTGGMVPYNKAMNDTHIRFISEVDHVAALHQAVAAVTSVAVEQIMGDEEDLLRALNTAYKQGQQAVLDATDDFLHDDPCDCDQCLIILKVRNRIRVVMHGYPTNGEQR
jgi:hypothetical protein